MKFPVVFLRGLSAVITVITVITASTVPIVSAAAEAPPTGSALAGRSGCMTCHDLVRKTVGPGFAQIAERYRDDAAAPDRLAAKIRRGSVGTWGRVIMPRQTDVTEAEARTLAGWVLSQPSPPDKR